jgi:hypothetical protein
MVDEEEEQQQRVKKKGEMYVAFGIRIRTFAVLRFEI